jgi:hypothetical protein
MGYFVMNAVLERNTIAAALACGLTFSSTALFAQQAPAVQIGQSIEGIDYQSSYGWPPNPNVAVGNNFVVETVDNRFRVFDKTTGAILFDQSLDTFFGDIQSGSEPVVVYDDTADRWYVAAYSGWEDGVYLTVSVSGDPTYGFLSNYLFKAVGYIPRLSFNGDAIFITSGTNGDPAATLVAIDKATALAGTDQIYYVSHPQGLSPAAPPAQMHSTGPDASGVAWFVFPGGTDAGGSTIRVAMMTGYLSDTPSFTYTSLPVTPYGNGHQANQPGGGLTTYPNTITTQVQYRGGHLVTAMASGVAPDGYVYPKGLYYDIDVSQGTPVLFRQGVIDPGPGVAVQMPSVDIDDGGNLGLTWMESSSTEYLSMWVGIVNQNGQLASAVAAPGGGFFYASGAIGRYSATVREPGTPGTFWSVNEYTGSDGNSDRWRTHITSFSAQTTATMATVSRR